MMRPIDAVISSDIRIDSHGTSPAPDRAIAAPPAARQFAGRGALRVVLCAAALLSSARMAAQERTLTVGAAAGGGLGIQTGSFDIYSSGSGCGVFDGGTIRQGWGEGRVALPSLFGSALGLALTAGVETQAANFIASDVGPYWYEDGQGTVRQTPQEIRYNTTTPMIRIGLGVVVRFLDIIDLTGGIWGGYRLAPVALQTLNLPGENPFPGSIPSVAMDSASVLSSSFEPTTVAFGPSLGLAAEIWLPGGFAIRPELGLTIDLLSPFRYRDLALRSYVFRPGIGVSLDLTPAPERQDPPAQPPADSTPRAVQPPSPVAELPPSRLKPLTASIALFGVDESDRPLPVATVHVYRVLRRSRVPMATSYLFAKSSASLPSDLPQLTRTQAAGFAPDSLASLGLERIALHSLNVLGWRLRENPRARVMLRGSTSKGEPSWLANARMETIRSYLEEVWSVEKGRIEIQPSATGGARAQRPGERSVTVDSDYPGLTDPIVVDRVEQSFDPPLVRLDPSFEGGAGIRSWNITLSHQGTTLARYSSSGQDGEEKSVNWKIPEERFEDGSFLEAELSVEDSAGTRIGSSARTPLAFDRNLRVVDAVLLPDGRERTVYTLYTDHPDGIDRRNREAIEEIARAVRDGGSVTVSRIASPPASQGDGDAAVEKITGAIRGAIGIARSSSAQTVRNGGTDSGLLAGDLRIPDYRTGEIAVVVERRGRGR